MDEYIKRFKQIRQEKGLSFEAVAKQLDLPESLVNLIELGEMVPTEKQLEKMMGFVIEHLNE